MRFIQFETTIDDEAHTTSVVINTHHTVELLASFGGGGIVCLANGSSHSIDMSTCNMLLNALDVTF